ncbi:MAG: hypothetical protein H6551_04110 [Chitinophagales bacterium]|nr:hypothetical protein [Chitinophagaceae bacterium]MCB9064307.1 hypothetical protein [Chitinophagales bacterium]
MKHNLLFVVRTLSILLFFHASVSAQNLGVYPTTLDFQLGGGQSESKVINLSNNSGDKVQFRIYLNDWVRDSSGGHAYYEPFTTPRSCAGWLNIDKNFIELQPGEATQLTVQMTVPADVEATKGMKWAMLFIETIEENVKRNDVSAEASVRNLLRVGVHVYETPPSLTEKGIQVVDLKANPELQFAYDLICKNTGDIMIECKAYLELTSEKGESTKLDFIEFPMFPDQVRYVTFELPKNLEDGKYNVLGVLDAGEDIPLEAVESTINLKTTPTKE